MSSQSDEPKKKRNWTKVALVISLGVNLIIFGLIGGAVIGGKGRAHFDDPLALRSYVWALPDAHRKQMRSQLQADHQMLEHGRQQNVQNRQRVIDSLRAEPFDLNRFAQALTLQQHAQSEMAVSGQRALVSQVAKMTGAERQDFARHLAHMKARDRSYRRK